MQPRHFNPRIAVRLAAGRPDNGRVDIHQMQVGYDAAADRLLWRLRTGGGEIVGVWLTRRMMQRLWPPLQAAVAEAGIARITPGSTVLPEARAMLAQAVRERPLPAANFEQPFDDRAKALPLGTEPLLAAEVDLTRGPGRVALRVREAGSARSLDVALSEELATALVRLLDRALAAADWGLAVKPGTPGAAAAPQRPH